MGLYRIMTNALCRILKVGLSGGICAGCLVFPAQALTLTEACQSALLNDPFFKSDTYAAQAGMEEFNLGLSNLLPEVTLNARKMDNRAQRDTYTNTNTLLTNEQLAYQSLGEGVYLRQPLFNLEKFSAYKAGTLHTEGAESQLVAGKQNAILRVTGAFLDVIIAEQEVELAIAKKKTVTAQAEQAAMFLSKGEATSAEADAVQSRLELASIQENEASDNKLIRVSTLSQLTAREVDALPEVIFDASQINRGNEPPQTLDQWLEMAIARNPEIIQKQQAVELAENETKKYLSSYLPNVDLVANVTRNNQDSFTTLNQDIRNRGIGIEMNWPLFKGGYYSALIRQARAKAEQAAQDVAAAKLRIRLEVERQYRGAVTGRLKLNALSQAIKTDAEKIKSAELSFSAGVKTWVDVLAAQEDFFQARKDYGNALKEFVMARLKLGALAGSLGDDQIAWAEKYLQTNNFH